MPNITYNFKGKVVLITGSSSGIGAGTALLFAKSGADLVITGRNAEKVSKVAEECQQISPENSEPLQVLADVSKEEDCKRLIETTIEKYGRLDILVNNAGYSGLTLIESPEFMESFKSVLETNLYSVVYLTHLCVEYLEKTKGNVINISSVRSLQVGKLMSAYCVSKSAMDMFTKCMASELGAKGIRVNSVNPGAVKTDILSTLGVPKDQQDSIWENHAKRYPLLGRYAVPEEIANDILFLASEESSFKTGTILVSDGGYLAANIDQSFDN